MGQLKLILFWIGTFSLITATSATGNAGQRYEIENGELDDLEERQIDYDYWLYGDGRGTRSSCKDSLPSIMSTNNKCKKLKQACWKLRSKCSSKLGNALGSSKNAKSCKTALGRNANKKVNTFCKIKCNKCANGGWSTYGSYGSCSVTCGGGTKKRSRTCSNPKPFGGGNSCSGSSTQTASCNTDVCCPVDGSYSDWGQWSSCSNTCENDAIKTRERNCTAPTCGGDDCQPTTTTMTNGTSITVGATDTDVCNQGIACTIDGNWAAWGNWTDCSKTCLGGMKNRTRTCSDPPPENDGANCTNSTAPDVTGNGLVETELVPCNSFPCDSDTFCLARNTDYKNNYGKCGPDYGRCNSYHNERFLYCDLATSECHDSEVKKNLQANDYFDSFPSSTCAIPCGNSSTPKAGIADVKSCAAMGGTEAGRNSAADCWTVCNTNNGKYGIKIAGIVWKEGSCGCITSAMLGNCEVNTDGNGYDYYEVDGTNCIM